MDLVELTPERLEAFKTALQVSLEECADEDAVYGLQCDSSRVVDTITGGVKNPEKRIFRLASLTKPITGVAAMMLMEDGVFAPSEPIDRFLPELANPHVLTRSNGALDATEPAHRAISIHDLLTCQMGIGLQFETPASPIAEAMKSAHVNVGATHPRQMDSDGWISALGQLPLICQPGTTWLYDTSIDALGVLLERASGMSLGSLFAERIFGPLGMEDTGFWVPEMKLNRLGPCVGRTAGNKLNIIDRAGAASRFANPPAFESAAEGLVSTAADYLTFATMMLNRGRLGASRLISEDAYTLMTRDHISPQQKTVSSFWPGFWESHGWGYCVAVQHGLRPDDPKGIGWIGGYGTACTWNQENGLISLLMSQQRFDEATFSLLTNFWRAARRLTD
ncbi:MAG: serine hydrolase domain-containing protein [Pseudomonadota bacterium]